VVTRLQHTFAFLWHIQVVTWGFYKVIIQDIRPLILASFRQDRSLPIWGFHSYFRDSYVTMFLVRKEANPSWRSPRTRCRRHGYLWCREQVPSYDSTCRQYTYRTAQDSLIRIWSRFDLIKFLKFLIWSRRYFTTKIQEAGFKFDINTMKFWRQFLHFSSFRVCV